MTQGSKEKSNRAFAKWRNHPAIDTECRTLAFRPQGFLLTSFCAEADIEVRHFQAANRFCSGL